MKTISNLRKYEDIRKYENYKTITFFLFIIFIFTICLFATSFAFAETTSTTPTIDNEQTSTSTLNSTTNDATSQSTASSTATTTIATTTATTATASTTSSTTTTSSTVMVNLNLRYQNIFIYSGKVAIPSSTNIVDSAGASHFTTSTNALTALIAADAASDNFAISNLQYYADWNSFYVKCIDISTPTATAKCDSWNYIVDGNYPSVGMDQYPLFGNENIYIYFNNPWQITVSTSTFPLGTTSTFHTWKYNYDDLSNEWTADPYDMIDISRPNPNPTGWWDATLTVTTTKSDGSGTVDYLFSTTGTYYAKITSADWTKWTFPITIMVMDKTIVAPSTSTTSTASTDNGSTNPPSGETGGVGGTTPPPTHQSIDVNKAKQFLTQNQYADGSFGSGLYTDWAAIALASTNESTAAKDKIKQYLLTDPDPIAGMNATSDYARRAMALMALNINPYSGTRSNYIQKLIDTHTGQQFGDANLFNDDIFALIPLLKADYSDNNPIIVSTTKFILSKQNPDGSWGGVDLTAAAIQTLSQLTTIDGVNGAVIKAKQYLHDQQQNDGGFSNSFAASWVLQSIAALGETEANWTKNQKTLSDYLYAMQSNDGGIESLSSPTTSRVWATSYAIPATLGKTWAQILHNFDKPIQALNNVGNAGSGGNPGTLDSNTTSTAATTTITLTTSTLTTSTITAATGDTVAETVTDATVKKDNKEPALSSTNKQNAEPILQSIPLKQEKQMIEAADKPTFSTATKQILSAGEGQKQQKIEQIIDELPLDTPTRRATKKVLALSGGSTLALGLYLGLKFFKKIV